MAQADRVKGCKGRDSSSCILIEFDMFLCEAQPLQILFPWAKEGLFGWPLVHVSSAIHKDYS